MPSFTVFKGAKDGKVRESQTQVPDLTGDQVLLKVTASGLCGTDLHYRKRYACATFSSPRSPC